MILNLCTFFGTPGINYAESIVALRIQITEDFSLEKLVSMKNNTSFENAPYSVL